MTILALLLMSLTATHLATRGRVRGKRASMIRPADEWTGEDVRHWLSLIEPFPLPEAEEAAWPR